MAGGATVQAAVFAWRNRRQVGIAAGLVVVVLAAPFVGLAAIFMLLAGAGEQDRVNNAPGVVPGAWLADVVAAGGICEPVTASLVAGVIDAASAWDAGAVSGQPVRKGLGGFIDTVWAELIGNDRTYGGADVFDGAAAIHMVGQHLCNLADLAEMTTQAAAEVSHPWHLTWPADDLWGLILAGYLDGWDIVEAYAGLVPFAQTAAWVTGVKTLATTTYADIDTIGALDQIDGMNIQGGADYSGIACAAGTIEVNPRYTNSASGVTLRVCQLQNGSKPISSIISGNTVAMIRAAGAAGVELRINSGLRTFAEQVVLWNRYQAGTGNLAARPGTSNHESGLALDLNVGSRGSPQWNWLADNAATFGFHNLPAECWHWSTNGH